MVIVHVCQPVDTMLGKMPSADDAMVVVTYPAADEIHSLSRAQSSLTRFQFLLSRHNSRDRTTLVSDLAPFITELESTNRKKGNKHVFIADSIADAEIADSRNSNWTAVAHVPRRRLVWRREEGN